MPVRTCLAAALALLMLCSVAPAGALVLCISDDGCASLETVDGWSGRCLESQCDDEHRDAGDQHQCRDTPVLQHSLPSPHATLAPPAALASAILPPPTALPPPRGSAHRAAAVAAPPGAAQVLRSVVLQL